MAIQFTNNIRPGCPSNCASNWYLTERIICGEHTAKQGNIFVSVREDVFILKRIKTNANFICWPDLESSTTIIHFFPIKITSSSSNFKMKYHLVIGYKSLNTWLMGIMKYTTWIPEWFIVYGNDRIELVEKDHETNWTKKKNDFWCRFPIVKN